MQRTSKLDTRIAPKHNKDDDQSEDDHLPKNSATMHEKKPKTMKVAHNAYFCTTLTANCLNLQHVCASCRGSQPKSGEGGQGQVVVLPTLSSKESKHCQWHHPQLGHKPLLVDDVTLLFSVRHCLLIAPESVTVFHLK